MKQRLPRKGGDLAPRRNLPAEERRREMLDAALDLFSEKGLGITVQELADRVGVTQPLVHRYFPTKADLITAVRDALQNAHWDDQWRTLLSNRDLGLEQRLASFYASYLPHIYMDRWYRGFLYASLDDPSFAQTYLTHADEELLSTIAAEMRATLGFPGFEDVPLFERETELVWGMHSTMVFGGIRRYVYKTHVLADPAIIVSDQIHAYLAIAPRVLAELMPR